MDNVISDRSDKTKKRVIATYLLPEPFKAFKDSPGVFLGLQARPEKKTCNYRALPTIHIGRLGPSRIKFLWGAMQWRRVWSGRRYYLKGRSEKSKAALCAVCIGLQCLALMCHHQALTGTRYPTLPGLFFYYPYPTRKFFKNFRVQGSNYTCCFSLGLYQWCQPLSSWRKGFSKDCKHFHICPFTRFRNIQVKIDCKHLQTNTSHFITLHCQTLWSAKKYEIL